MKEAVTLVLSFFFYIVREIVAGLSCLTNSLAFFSCVDPFNVLNIIVVPLTQVVALKLGTIRSSGGS